VKTVDIGRFVRYYSFDSGLAGVSDDWVQSFVYPTVG